MGAGALEVLRALKYDLDQTDGAITEQSLEGRALERLRLHIDEVRRIDRGLPAEGRREEHATAAQVILTALNHDAERYRWADGGLLVQSELPQNPGLGWVPADMTQDFGRTLLRDFSEAAMEEVRALGCFCIDIQEAALSLTRAGSPGHAVLGALGVDADALRSTLLPLASTGDRPKDRDIPWGARSHDAMWVEPQAEALRLGATGTQPEHVVLGVLRAARGDLLLALEAHAATYHLMRLRLTAEPALLPWSPEVVRVLVRAHALARQAHRGELYPNFVAWALAEEGPSATPDADSNRLLQAIQATERCPPAPQPLPASLPVALGWNLGSSSWSRMRSWRPRPSPLGRTATASRRRISSRASVRRW